MKATLILIIAFPLLVFLFNRFLLKKWLNTYEMALIIFVGVFFIIAVVPYIKDYFMMQQLETFDLNGDGLFSEQEKTPEAKQLIQSLSNNTGLAFAPIVGLIVAILYSGLFYWSLTIYNWLRQRIKGHEI